MKASPRRKSEVLSKAMPLEGIRVLDLTRALSGPFCTMMLADMGAEVIKVEPPAGDETRLWGPPFIGEVSTYFLSVNRNKKSIAIDLKEKEGVRILKRIVASSQVFVENYRPGTTEKLGIDYNALRRINRDLVYCSISAFGQTGPSRLIPGYDIITFAASGMMSITGEPGRPPVKVGVPISDICSGMYGAYAILGALYRLNSGKSTRGSRSASRGEYIDVSMLEGQISWLTHQASAYFATGENPGPLGSMHPSIAPYQAFKGSDSEYFVVGVANEQLWIKFCDALGLGSIKKDERFSSNALRVEYRVELVEALSNFFSSKTAAEWVETISAGGVPCGPINKLSKVFEDPQVVARKMVLECNHPEAGKIKQLAVPYHFGSKEFTIRSPPPTLGEHTDTILSESGYSKSKIKSLRDSSVIVKSHVK